MNFQRDYNWVRFGPGACNTPVLHLQHSRIIPYPVAETQKT